MFKKKVAKIALVLACLVTLIMPHMSVVLAKTLTQDTTSDNLGVRSIHPGGPERSGALVQALDKALSENRITQEQYLENLRRYDTTPYEYEVGGVKMFKIASADDVECVNELYCLNALKPFPGVNHGEGSLLYNNIADLKDPSDANVTALNMGTSYTANSEKWTENYNAVIWLIDNFYLSHNAPAQKADYLEKAFAGYDGGDLDTVKVFLTDDDIDIVQQRAIWYFTNNETDTYNTENLPAVKLTDNLAGRSGSYQDITGYNYRQDMADYLYQYLIRSAKEGARQERKSFPSFENNTENLTFSKDDNYYIIGPIKVKSGNAAPSEYTIQLLDQDGKEIDRRLYEIRLENEQEPTNLDINQIFDTNYYIYIPKTNKSIVSGTITLKYTDYGTQASLWENDTVDPVTNEVVYQPVVLITRDPVPYTRNLKFAIDRRVTDLALRKYVAQVGDTKVHDKPVVDITGLKNGSSTTASYKQSKTPVEVKVNDTIIYEIRVYNEGDLPATGIEVFDTLPKGLELVEGSSINTTFGWELARDGENSKTYVSRYLKNESLRGFNKETDTELPQLYVQIECKISSEPDVTSTYTNIAEIAADGIEDIDSTPGNHDYSVNDYDTNGYKGDNSNPEDLSRDDYYYKGREDDDDFSSVKIIIEKKSFDLNLKKFISKINNKAPSVSREPVPDVTKLKNRTSTNADYKTVKTALEAKQGDVIIYTLRVYNEGQTDGYAEEIADYLPEGLGFLVNHTVNVDNLWSIPEDAKTVKLNTIKYETKNISADDFTGVRSLDDVDVVVGKVKLTSSKLKSSTDQNYLIKAFDPETGKLLYKDVQIACIVLVDNVENDNLRNIAEVTKNVDKDGKPVDDVDSTPDTVNPDNYPGDDKNQDDNDYEKLTTNEPEKFDLSLKKFISKLNGSGVSGREPKFVKSSDGVLKVETPNVEPLKVENEDVITYTLRVYNEGNTNGYASEISDTIPKGLTFLTKNETNVKYGWKMYDSNGNVTTDVSQAVTVKTDYLSKQKAASRGDNCLLAAYDSENANRFDYRDVEIVFQVNESVVTDSARKIKNIAEITDDSDENGNPIDDIDSTPDNKDKKPNEDDTDDEEVYVKYFDLELIKTLTKIIVTEDGTTREITVSKDGLQKVEIHRKKIEKTVVKFVYTITVKNTGEIEGYATEIIDYIPTGLKFVAEDNKKWTKVSDNVIATTALEKTLLKPGQSASVEVVLQWINGENNMGLKTNAAEISKDKNDSNTKDRDSTPDNKKPEEDDYDTAEVFLAVSTGTSQTYFTLAFVVLAIMTTGVILIKKYVLE